MAFEHWMLAAIVTLGVGLNAWLGWLAYQVHRAHVVLVLQNRSFKDIVRDLITERDRTPGGRA